MIYDKGFYVNVTNPPAIFVEDLWFSYDSNPVLEDVNISVPRGDFVSIVGPNGGGKTTLLKLILGLLKPSRGRALVFGEEPEQARRRIGYMPNIRNWTRNFLRRLWM